jgi:hypothetical protein
MSSPCYRKQSFFNSSYTQYIICIGSCSDGAHNLIHEVSYFEAFKNGHLMDMVGGVAPPNDHYLLHMVEFGV